jgi:predicted acylesterase/phospholipase RssA
MKTKTSRMEVRKEIRFAVVMYGGVSLAIYINGVAQELLKMVRATTADARSDHPLLPDEKLRGTERVYRQLGQILGREGEEAQRPVDPDIPTPIRTRFTVDILSGTSAGGINAVYLAKALANCQTIDQLKQLWVEEGDLLKLINDAKSVEQLDGLKVQKPPRSLLNSQRMYRRLLEALDGMEEDNPSTEKSRSPYLEELDLFVTVTDFHGLPIQLRLSDDVVEERRHRNVFHFRYAHEHSQEASNDFHAGNDPFLAYAARCTSAFPFAFDPMKLSDINAVLETMTAHRHLGELGLDRDRWQRFFPDYRQPAGDRAHSPETYDFTGRPFVDGGYLDNKPFGHAIDNLAIRNSGVPVDRKLIYIDPSPEMSAQWAQDGDPINPVENIAAAFSLARYETIREDLQRVHARNRLIARVESIISEKESDVRNKRRLGVASKPNSRKDFGKKDLDHYDMITYPILYSTEVGEEIDAVDVLRVSPEDATSLIDERDPNERRRKLAGTSLRNFGAFLDRGWRRNDIMWGRLDGAERIVSALLPGDKYEVKREKLIKEAHLAILEEEVLAEDRHQVLQLIANALATTDSTGGNEAALRRLVEGAGNSSLNLVLEEVLRSRLTREELLEFSATATR